MGGVLEWPVSYRASKDDLVFASGDEIGRNRQVEDGSGASRLRPPRLGAPREVAGRRAQLHAEIGILGGRLQIKLEPDGGGRPRDEQTRRFDGASRQFG